MSLKGMCAGCSAEERERAESDVRRALGPRAATSETWIVSVINLQSRWSVTLDGPGIRALNCTAPPGRLAEAILEALQSKLPAATAPAPSAPAPAAGAAPARAAAPAAATPGTPTAAPAPALPPRATAAPAAAARPAAQPAAASARPVPTPAAAPAPRPAAAPAPRPAAPPPRPTAAGAAGPRRAAHECAQCHQRFSVAFDGVAGEPDLLTPVACPHCWH